MEKKAESMHFSGQKGVRLDLSVRFERRGSADELAHVEEDSGCATEDSG